MTVNDRRSGRERRRAARSTVGREIHWENHAGHHRGILSDISVTGCYVLTSGVHSVGERVLVGLPLTDGSSVRMPVEVVNSMPEIGFAGRFVDLSESQQGFLDSFVEMHADQS